MSEGTFKPRTVPIIDGIKGYSVPRPKTEIKLKLDANEGVPPGPSLLEKISGEFSSTIGRYPQGENPLVTFIAGKFGLESQQVMVTNGGDDGIDRLCRAFLMAGRRMVIPTPTFEMFEYFARLTGAEVVKIPWAEAFPVEEMISVGEGSAVVCFPAPNNPTGAAGTADDLRALSRALPRTIILADFAYVEFADFDLTAAALKLPNVLVLRTCSKAWGMAGLRVGWMMGPEYVLHAMKLAGPPYHNPVTSAIALARMKDGAAEMALRVERVRTERTELEALLAALGAEPRRSHANFVWCEFRSPTEADSIRHRLGEQGISVRGFPGRKGVDGGLRITCPCNEAAFSQLCDGLRKAFAA